MAIIDLEVLDAFDSFGDAIVQSESLVAMLRDKWFDVSDIVDTLYYLVNRGILVINITGGVQRA
jgi:hypothetical protein